MGLLSWMILLPMVASVLCFALRLPLAWVKTISIATTFAVLMMALKLYADFQPVAGLQFEEHYPWIEAYGIHYHVAVDGISLPLVMMTALLMPVIAVGLFRRSKRGYWNNLLLAQAGIMGALLAQDLILFYLFWETMLLPIFFMIGMFGHGRNHFITMKFTVYTIFGSLMMLVGILYLATQFQFQFGHYSFALEDLRQVCLSETEALFTFGAFMLAFAIKVPLFPFHTWLSDTYRSAPTGTMVVLSALMAKLGVYAIWRFTFTIFETLSSELAPFFIAVGLFGMIYFGIIAVSQTNLKRLLAYSSASHLSLMVVGIFFFNHYGVMGSGYFIAAHAVASAGLFLMTGMMYERTRNHEIDMMGGIAIVAPRFALFFSFFALAVVGVPGTAGFVAELLIVLGAFKYDLAVGFITATTILIAMTFMFTMLKKTIYGPQTQECENFDDLRSYELIALIPLALLTLAMGIFPNLFMTKIRPGIEASLPSAKVIHVH